MKAKDDELPIDPSIPVEFHLAKDELRRRTIQASRETQESSEDTYVESIENWDELKIGPIKKRSLSLSRKKTTTTKNENEELPFEHSLPLGELIDYLETSSDTGLSEDEATTRLNADGHNVIKPPKPSVIWKIIDLLFGGFNGLLFLGSIACFVAWRLGDPPDPNNLGLAIILLVVLGIFAGFTAYQTYKSNRVMESISKLLPAETLVLRGGEQKMIELRNLVAGDIVFLKTGDQIPADLRYIQVKQLSVDQSSLTGESEPVMSSVKTTSDNYMESRNMGFLGTSVIEGQATAVVVSTGNNTVMGKIAHSASSSKEEATYLQLEIRRLVRAIALIAFLLSAALIGMWSGYIRVEEPNFMSLPTMIVTIIGIVVAVLPDGLPVCLVLALTVIASEMAKNNILVKQLNAVETLGSVNYIASDKTGTLTQNKMTVINLYTGLRLVESIKNDSDSKSKQVHSWMDLFVTKDYAFLELLRITYLCNNANYVHVDESLDESKEFKVNTDVREVRGDASDTALFRFAESFVNIDKEREKYKKLYEIPFNSKNKFALTLFQCEESENKGLLLIKGAAEIMLSRCTTILQADGEEVRLSSKLKKKILKQQEKFGAQGQRVLGLCKRWIKPTESFSFFDKNSELDPKDVPHIDDLCYVGMVGLIDPPRPEVFEAIRTCKSAGINVMMVTGDHYTTAVAIARMVGIINKEKVEIVSPDTFTPDGIHEHPETDSAAVVVGSTLSSFDDQIWDWVFGHSELVFARTTPENKLQIVKECQKRGHSVGVTGDGVNDASALKQADVGIAMGSGTEVSKEASDIVLTDNNFASIIVGIKYGRLIFHNLKKVLLYLFPSGSFSELIPVILNCFFGMPLALSSFLMIYLACVSDVPSSLSIIKETSESNIMRSKPRKKTKHLVDWKTILHAYLYIGIIECTGAYIMYFTYLYVYEGIVGTELIFLFGGWQEGFHNKTQEELTEIVYTGQSVYFIGVVMIQIGSLLANRTQYLSFFQHNPFFGKGKNLYLFVGILFTLALDLLIIYVPFFNSSFGTRPIPWEFWFLPLIFSVILFFSDEARKLIKRRMKHHHDGIAVNDNRSLNNASP